MSAQISSAAIVISAIVLYQVGMKLVPHSINPFGALIIFYVTALVCTLVVARFVPAEGPLFALSHFSWSAALVGVAIVGIELGYLLMYRSGWNLGAAPIVGMGTATLLLVPISVLVFKQPWSLRYVFGIVFCIYGLFLLMPREA
ncbi:MAG: hypothetical protein AB8B57_15525 [Congregibacter sp.]